MLSNTDGHILSRGHIGDWWLAGVCVGDPERNGEPICCPSEVDRQRAHQVEEEGREARLISWRMCQRAGDLGVRRLTIYIGPRRERGVLRQRVRNIVVGPIGVVVSLLGIVVVLG